MPLYVAVLGCLLVAGCRSEAGKKKESNAVRKDAGPTATTTFHFVDRTADSGVQAVHVNGGESGFRTMLETLGGGVGIFDFDRDGLPDFFVNGGGKFSAKQEILGAQSFFYRNLAGWRFDEIGAGARPDTRDFYNHGCAVGDLDNDGFQDLVVTGYQSLAVYRNQGDGSFERMSCGMETNKWATSACVLDADGDGSLDVFVCNYLQWTFANHKSCPENGPRRDVCSPRFYDGEVDTLFVNEGDWSFTDQSDERGITKAGKGLGVVSTDIDLDGDIDLYVANDVTNNFLYLNDGTGKFVEDAGRMGVDTGEGSMPNGSMGVDVVDFNNDLLPDIGVANFESENFALYQQVSLGDSDKRFFDQVSRKTRLSAVPQLYVGWGTCFEDWDGDSDLDLIVNNGHISYHSQTSSMDQTPLILENRDLAFEPPRVGGTDYFSEKHHGRGLAAADFDSDGDLDLLFANCNQNVALLENRTSKLPSVRRLTVIGLNGNRDGVGLSLRFAGAGRDRLRQLKGGHSYLSASPRPLSIPKNWVFTGLVPPGPDLQRESAGKITILFAF